MDIIYFWYSFIFLLSRTVVFSLLTAAVHDESKKPVNVLRDVPSKTWCSEVERFIEEVVCSTIALSGMRFFFMTRKLILSVREMRYFFIIRMSLSNNLVHFFHFCSPGGGNHFDLRIGFNAIRR